MVAIIPQPLHVESPAGGGALRLDGAVLVAGPSPAEQRIAAYAEQLLTGTAGARVTVAGSVPDGVPPARGAGCVRPSPRSRAAWSGCRSQKSSRR